MGYIAFKNPQGVLLINRSEWDILTANADATSAAEAIDEDPPDHSPVVKLFTPTARSTWLLTEVYPESGMAYGLCDLGLGFPELGYVSLRELAGLRGPLSIGVEKDLWFTPSKTLSTYADDARRLCRIAA